MKVEKPSAHDKGDHVGDQEEKDEAMPVHVRHSHERHNLHSKHEHEHSIHDHHEEGHKHEMHKRHQEEMKSMHTKHEKEAGHTAGRETGAGGAAEPPIEKIEKGAKG